MRLSPTVGRATTARPSQGGRSRCFPGRFNWAVSGMWGIWDTLRMHAGSQPALCDTPERCPRCRKDFACEFAPVCTPVRCILGVEMKTLPVKRSQPANQAPTYRWYPCARVRPCVPCVSCVSRLPPVSFYRYSTGTRYKYGTVHGTLAKGCIPWIYCGIRSGFSRSPVARS